MSHSGLNDRATLRALEGSSMDDEEDVIEGEDDFRAPANVIALDLVDAPEIERLPTKIPAVDKLMTGGLVPGSVIVLGGDPGAGKSSLVLMLSEAVGAIMVYFSGEMTPKRLRATAKRLRVHTSRVFVVSTKDIDEACAVDPQKLVAGRNKGRPIVAVFDSIQVFTSRSIRGAPGSTTQLPYVMKKVVEWTQENDAIGIAISRFNSHGEISGPNDTQHDGDVTMTLTFGEDGAADSKRLLTVLKNRDGSTGQIACSMGSQGLIF